MSIWKIPWWDYISLSQRRSEYSRNNKIWSNIAIGQIVVKMQVSQMQCWNLIKSYTSDLKKLHPYKKRLTWKATKKNYNN